MQAPGGPEEDSKGSFPYSGWTVSLWDEEIEKEIGTQIEQEFELLLE